VKEVPGIFTADPTVIPEAIPIPVMDYAAAAGMSLGGARILKDACIEMAERYGIELRVGNSHKLTVVTQKAAEPFFNLTVKDGFSLYRLDNTAEIPVENGEGEIVEAAGTIYAAISAKYAESLEICKSIIPWQDGISRLTAVGDGMELLVQYIKEEPIIEEIYLAVCQYRQAHFYFRSLHSQKVINNLHRKMAGKIFSEGEK